MTGRQVLKAQMKEKGLTPQQLAAESGVHITTVRRYLGKKYGGPIDIGPDAAPKLARVLGCEASELIFGRAA